MLIRTHIPIINIYCPKSRINLFCSVTQLAFRKQGNYNLSWQRQQTQINPPALVRAK